MDSEIQKRMARLRADIRELKSNQTFGGDSWVMYRTKMIDIWTPVGSIIQIDFQPETEGPFVAKAYLVPHVDDVIGLFSEIITPDPNYDGRWYFTSTSGDTDYYSAVLVFSTKPGKIISTRIDS